MQLPSPSNTGDPFVTVSTRVRTHSPSNSVLSDDDDDAISFLDPENSSRSGQSSRCSWPSSTEETSAVRGSPSPSGSPRRSSVEYWSLPPSRADTMQPMYNRSPSPYSPELDMAALSLTLPPIVNTVTPNESGSALTENSLRQFEHTHSIVPYPVSPTPAEVNFAQFEEPELPKMPGLSPPRAMHEFTSPTPPWMRPAVRASAPASVRSTAPSPSPPPASAPLIASNPVTPATESVSPALQAAFRVRAALAEIKRMSLSPPLIPIDTGHCSSPRPPSLLSPSPPPFPPTPGGENYSKESSNYMSLINLLARPSEPLEHSESPAASPAFERPISPEFQAPPSPVHVSATLKFSYRPVSSSQIPLYRTQTYSESSLVAPSPSPPLTGVLAASTYLDARQDFIDHEHEQEQETRREPPVIDIHRRTSVAYTSSESTSNTTSPTPKPALAAGPEPVPGGWEPPMSWGLMSPMAPPSQLKDFYDEKKPEPKVVLTGDEFIFGVCRYPSLAAKKAPASTVGVPVSYAPPIQQQQQATTTDAMSPTITPVLEQLPPPLNKARFDATYKSFCINKNLNPKSLSMDNKPIDIYLLHVYVMQEGGETVVTQKNLWPVIAARLGLVHFHGMYTVPPKSGPDAALYISQVYKEYLAMFDELYIGSVRYSRISGLRASAPGAGSIPVAPALAVPLPSVQPAAGFARCLPMGNAQPCSAGISSAPPSAVGTAVTPTIAELPTTFPYARKKTPDHVMQARAAYVKSLKHLPRQNMPRNELKSPPQTMCGTDVRPAVVEDVPNLPNSSISTLASGVQTTDSDQDTYYWRSMFKELGFSESAEPNKKLTSPAVNNVHFIGHLGTKDADGCEDGEENNKEYESKKETESKPVECKWASEVTNSPPRHYGGMKFNHMTMKWETLEVSDTQPQGVEQERQRAEKLAGDQKRQFDAITVLRRQNERSTAAIVRTDFGGNQRDIEDEKQRKEDIKRLKEDKLRRAEQRQRQLDEDQRQVEACMRPLLERFDSPVSSRSPSPERGGCFFVRPSQPNFQVGTQPTLSYSSGQGNQRSNPPPRCESVNSALSYVSDKEEEQKVLPVPSSPTARPPPPVYFPKMARRQNIIPNHQVITTPELPSWQCGGVSLLAPPFGPPKRTGPDARPLPIPGAQKRRVTSGNPYPPPYMWNNLQSDATRGRRMMQARRYQAPISPSRSRSTSPSVMSTREAALRKEEKMRQERSDSPVTTPSRTRSRSRSSSSSRSRRSHSRSRIASPRPPLPPLINCVYTRPIIPFERTPIMIPSGNTLTANLDEKVKGKGRAVKKVMELGSPVEWSPSPPSGRDEVTVLGGVQSVRSEAKVQIEKARADVQAKWNAMDWGTGTTEWGKVPTRGWGVPTSFDVWGSPTILKTDTKKPTSTTTPTGHTSPKNQPISMQSKSTISPFISGFASPPIPSKTFDSWGVPLSGPATCAQASNNMYWPAPPNMDTRSAEDAIWSRCTRRNSQRESNEQLGAPASAPPVSSFPARNSYNPSRYYQDGLFGVCIPPSATSSSSRSTRTRSPATSPFRKPPVLVEQNAERSVRIEQAPTQQNGYVNYSVSSWGIPSTPPAVFNGSYTPAYTGPPPLRPISPRLNTPPSWHRPTGVCSPRSYTPIIGGPYTTSNTSWYNPPYSSRPTYGAPVNNPYVYNPSGPLYNQGYNASVYNPLVYSAQGHNPPVYNPPVYNPPVYNGTPYIPPIYSGPIYNPPNPVLSPWAAPAPPVFPIGDRFWFADGNVAFDVEGKKYHVHKYFFEQRSSFFRSLLVQYDDTYNEPIILHGTSSEDFERLLTVFYPKSFLTPDLNTVDEWKSVLKLATEWGLGDIRSLAIEKLAPIASAVDKVVIGHAYDIPSWLAPAYKALVEQEVPFTVEEGKMLGIEKLLNIMQAKQELYHMIPKEEMPAWQVERRIRSLFALDGAVLGPAYVPSTNQPTEI